MNELASTPPPASPPRTGRGRRLFLGLFVLALLAGLGAGGWKLWTQLRSTTETLEAEDALIRRLSYQMRELEAQTDSLARRQDDADSSVRRNGQQIAALQNQQEASQLALARIDETLRGGRARFQLAAVEELLLLANDRIRLARDAAGAIQALELADARLAGLSDPRLTGVREALAQERLALLAAPRVDLAGAALSLASLIDRAPQLPLRARAPDHFEPRADSREDQAHLPADAEWPERVWAGMKSALSSVFRIQRETRPVDRLLPPAQEALVQQLLLMKLEGARLALLRGEPGSFRDLVEGARAWLADYYKPDDPLVLAVDSELERLRGLELAPRLPEPSKSLERLRAVLRSAP